MNFNHFEKAYRGLNEKQKQAVDTVYGPLMVVAGPGTGKTQLLSTRVGNILQKTDFKPYNILCITYTTNGVAAMKQRLVELIGAEGNGVEVYTFHSFSEKIIQRAKRYNQTFEFRFMDELEKRTIIRKLLEQVDFNTPLKKAVNSIDVSIKFLLDFFAHIKKENYDVDSLIQAYEEEKITKKNSEEFTYKKDYKDKKKGDLKEDKWQAFEERLNKHIQACGLYKEYKKQVEAENWNDYDDLINTAIDLVNKFPDLRYDLQEQYQVIMIDEFQDTNGAQLELIHQLCLENDEPNIMVVGDEDQSIFRFQGANLYNIFDFHTKYLSHYSPEEQFERIIVLNQNYRSTPIILESSRALIENNTERITHLIPSKKLIKKLEAAHPMLKTSMDVVEVIELANADDEYIPIALEIEKLVQNGAKYEDIAVLFPKNSDAKIFSEYLTLMEYPFELSKEENILEDPLISSYVQLFHLIQSFRSHKSIQAGDWSDFIFQPWHQISLYDISRFWVDWRQYRAAEDAAFLPFIQDYEGVLDIQTLNKKLQSLIQMQDILPLQRYFHYILDTFMIKEWAVSQPHRMDILQKIEVLDYFLQDFLYAYPEAKFNDFVERLEAYRREGIEIKYIKHIVQPNCIKLMTYHKSKGLEFDYVFVKTQGTGKGRSSGIYIPESVMDKDFSDIKEEEHALEESRRLLYVAMTRAKKKLYLTDVVKEKSKNKFIDELPVISEEDFDKTSSIQALAIRKKYQINEADYLRFVAINRTDLDVKYEKLFENQYIEDRLKNFALSHSSINTYLECPQKFYFEKIINIPAAQSLAMTAGHFYHSVLEHYFKAIQQDPSQATVNKLLSLAQELIYRYKNKMTDVEFNDIRQAMEANLPILYEQFLANINQFNYDIETKLDANLATEVNITGILDKLDHEIDRLNIFDFKTGKKSNAVKYQKLNPFDPDKVIEIEATVDEKYGGGYWRQAMLYHILVKKNFPQRELEGTNFVFIQPEKNKIEFHTIAVDKQGENYMENLTKKVYQQINQKMFEPCCKPDCSWCSQLAYRQQNSL